MYNISCTCSFSQASCSSFHCWFHFFPCSSFCARCCNFSKKLLLLMVIHEDENTHIDVIVENSYHVGRCEKSKLRHLFRISNVSDDSWILMSLLSNFCVIFWHYPNSTTRLKVWNFSFHLLLHFMFAAFPNVGLIVDNFIHQRREMTTCTIGFKVLSPN